MCVGRVFGTSGARSPWEAGLRQTDAVSCALASRCDSQLFFAAEVDGEALFEGDFDAASEGDADEDFDAA
ncbi:hypothetical protein SALBM311S_05044 [Streptomyces alboniger]